MIPLLLCGIWLSHLKKQMATTKADYPGAKGWSSKDGEVNMGVCIEDGFMFFLKQYNYRLFLKVCLIFYHAILIASFSTLSHIELSDFSFFYFSPFADWGGSEVWASSAWDGLVGTSSARLMEWEGGGRAVLSYPLLVQNVMRNCSGITNWDTWSRVSGFFLCCGGCNP